MKSQNKELLIKDLCSRLPYGIKGQAKGMIKFFGDEEVSDEPWTLTDINVQCNRFGADSQINIPLYNRIGECNFKPYLFPMSSMTEEQKKELVELGLAYYTKCEDIDDDGVIWVEKVIQIMPGTETDDWLLEHHFDHRGLIDKGLALDATGLNIY